MRTRSTFWDPCYRILPSHFPPVNLFETVADPADLDAVFALESLTNPQIRQEAGDLHLVPEAERISGPGTGPIMAAFTHLNPSGSRFSDGTYGVYYAASTLDTAIAETVFHLVLRLQETREPAQDLDMRVVLAVLKADLWDVRGPGFAPLRDPDPATYGAGQALGRAAKAKGADGILYRSVRHAGGECAAVLRPKVLAGAGPSRHLIYPWNGKEIDTGRICVKALLG